VTRDDRRAWAGVVLMLAVAAVSIALWSKPVYDECRGEGHSIAYCLHLVSGAVR
jgi:hypothetical protein